MTLATEGRGTADDVYINFWVRGVLAPAIAAAKRDAPLAKMFFESLMFTEICDLLDLNTDWIRGLAFNEKPITGRIDENWIEGWWEKQQRIYPEWRYKSYMQYQSAKKREQLAAQTPTVQTVSMPTDNSWEMQQEMQ